MSQSSTEGSNPSPSIESLRYVRGALEVIDQLKLPVELVYVPVRTVQDAWSTIRTMQVRGAPLIAIVAMLGLAVDAYNKQVEGKFGDNVATVADFLKQSLAYLRTSRPTAVNLFTAANEMDALIDSLAKVATTTAASLIAAVVEAAEFMWQLDVNTNKAMGAHGGNHILNLYPNKPRIKVLTICNTGSLATAGYGTALGVVRYLHENNRLEHVYACETRPYNQGARLTAFEIMHENMPGTLITDSMAAYLMATRGVDCVVVGADRVAANGDTANKIGTYMLSIVAKHHGVPFFVAAPTTTLDLTMSSGTEIHVEERPAQEMTQ
jgi:methylthioribose-1-phosphate isomerase